MSISTLVACGKSDEQQESNTTAPAESTEASETVNTETSNNNNNDTNLEENSESEQIDTSSSTESSAKEISVDDATRKKMNIFLSNFSESSFEAYDKDNQNVQELLWWSFLWTKRNKFERLESASLEEQNMKYDTRISLDNINKATEKYFGLQITSQQAEGMHSDKNSHPFTFKDGYLYSVLSDGESMQNFSLTTKVEDLGDGKLKLYFNVYSQNVESTDGIDYGLTTDKFENDHKSSFDDPSGDYQKLNSGFAIVKTVDSSYILEYIE